MEPQTPSAVLKSSADFEQFKADGIEASLSQLGLFEHLAAKQNKELIAERMKLKPKGIGSKAVTGKSLALKIAFKFFDTVLTLAAMVIPGKDLLGSARSVGNEKSQVGPQSRDFNFNQYPSFFSPAFSSVAKAIEASKRPLGAGIAADGLFEPALRSFLKDRVGSNSHDIEDFERLQSLIDLWRSRAGIGPVAKLSFGKTAPENGNQTAKLSGDGL
jgi:hypothetical protein